MKKIGMISAAIGVASLFMVPANAATVVIYDQDFENPAAYNNDGGDVGIFNTVNDSYGNQPVGFEFAQSFTVETLNVTGSERGAGTAAFGTGWSDPSGQSGDFAIGMLSNAQNDLLGLNFDVGTAEFFNLSIDISGIDLSTFGGTFGSDGVAPEFQLTLFDNPSGVSTTGAGTILAQETIIGTASDQDVFDWTTVIVALSTLGNTNGNVTLRIDLLVGGYAAFDNLIIAASDTAGDVGEVPLPAAFWFMGAGIAAYGTARKKKAAA